MAKLIAHDPPKATLKSSGFMGEPTGEITITTNGKHNVKSVAVADVKVPQPFGQAPDITTNGDYNVKDFESVKVALLFEEQEVTPSTIEQTVTPTPNTEYQALSAVKVNPAPLVDTTITPDIVEYTYTPQAPAIGFSSVTVEGYIPPAEKDINIYNYLGDLIFSYTFQEALALTELPTAPPIEGMVFQEYNWSLENIKSYAQKGIPVTVGAIYDTDDHSTRLYFYNEKYTALSELTVGVQMLANTSATVDWGDGTTGVLENTSNKTVYVTATKSDYAVANESKNIMVSIHGEIYELGRTGYQPACFEGNESLLVKVEIGSECEGLSNFAFNGLSISIPKLKAISIANGCNHAGNDCLRNLTGLKALCYPTSLMNISTSNLYSLEIYTQNDVTAVNPMINSAYSLTKVTLSPSVSSIAGYVCRNARSLSYVYIPYTVTSIGVSAFDGSGLKVVDLSGFEDSSTVPSLENTNAFPGSAIFLVRSQERLDAFEAATNWSAYAGRYQIKGAT